jgi:hypothetical protein
LLLHRYWEQFQFRLAKTDTEIARRMRYTPEELAQVKASLAAGAPLPPCPRQAALDSGWSCRISVVSGRTRKGNKWLRRTMSEAAWAASHTKDTYFAAQLQVRCAPR